MENSLKFSKIQGKTTIKKRRQNLSQKQISEGCAKGIKDFMSTTSYTLFLCILTIYTIFAIDIDKGFFYKNASQFFSTMHAISMAIFVLEIVLMSLVQKDYIFRFHFWIDIFSTLTMVLELIWVQDLMSSVNNIQVAVSFTKVSKASRFSKIGARSTKILKLIRLIKLFKFVKKDQKEQNQKIVQQVEKVNQQIVQQGVSQTNKKQAIVHGIKFQQINESRASFKKLQRPNVNKQQQQMIQMRWQLQSEQIQKTKQQKRKEQKTKGTKVGEKLNYEIQKNLVIMVMGLIMIIPILNADTWYNKVFDMQPTITNYIQIMSDSANSSFVDAWVQNFILISVNSSEPIVYFEFNDHKFPQDYMNRQNLNIPNVNDLRLSEKTVVNNYQSDQIFFKSIFSKKRQVQITSWINMGRSVFIILLLLFASIFFIRDLQNYALNPLQKMNTTVQKIQKDPFSVLETNNQEAQDEDLIQQDKQQEETLLQTNILQKFFIKITGLLALGVGETPFRKPEAIAQQSSRNSSIFDESGPVKVEGVFVCVQIAHLQQIMQNIQDSASHYINTVFQVFHEVVIQNGGFIFHQDQLYSVVCWKLYEQGFNISQKHLQNKLQEKKKAQLALMTYVKFCERISQQPRLRKYLKLTQIIPNYESYKIHLGIHCGVAYCGPIGSQFKLSLKAMGQGVAVAKTLCQISKKYRLQNLHSSVIIKNLPFMALISRKIDQFQVVDNGYKVETVQAYSALVDCHFRTNLRTQSIIDQKDEQKFQENQLQQRLKIKKILKQREQLIVNNGRLKTEELLNYCKHFLKKNQNIEDWIDLWKETNAYYQQGQWIPAKAGFQTLKEFCPHRQDKVCQLRLEQIGKRQEPPTNWKKIKKIQIFF